MKKNNRKRLVVFVGLPASGKSTLREQHELVGVDKNTYQYSTDDAIDIYATLVEKTYSEVFKEYSKEATRIADAGLENAMNLGYDIIWDQTNMSAKKRQKILNRFDNNYRKECICVLPPFTISQKKELDRRLNDRTGKFIPEHVMQSMQNSFQLPSTNEGFHNVKYLDIFGNPVDRNHAADLFGEHAKPLVLE